MSNSSYQIEVSGDLACFTRPELKVERVSYHVITPSAVRAIFEAIYWKPSVCWQVGKIEILNPIAFAHIKRCEVSAIANIRKTHIVAEDHRQLRHSVLLRDVHYRLTATLSSLDGSDDKHNAIFKRRAIKGQCFAEPYLGCREFTCSWRLVTEIETTTLKQPIPQTKDLGIMLYDLDFTDPTNPTPQLFRAEMIEGVITPKIL